MTSCTRPSGRVRIETGTGHLGVSISDMLHPAFGPGED